MTTTWNREDLWSKKCPKCGHSALEHKYDDPRDTSEWRYRYPRHHLYCWHPVPSAENKDYDTFCECKLDEKDYWKVRNGARIRATAK